MNFVPVRIATLRPDDYVNFDVYIKLGDRFLHYIRNAEPFDAERLEKLKGKGVKKLFITEAEEMLYIKYLDMGLDRLNNKSLSKAQQGAFVRDAMTTEAENAQRNIQTKEGYFMTERRVEKLVKFLTADSGALKTVIDATGFSVDNFQHAGNVAAMALALAPHVGITKPKQLLELGLACLVHDIGKSELGIDPNQSRENMDKEGQKKWDLHPTEGAHLLANKPYIDAAVLEMIQNHEERGNALGPNKKVFSQLPDSTQLLCLCNEYDRQAIIKQIPPKEVIRTFYQEKIGLYNLNHINALAGLLK